MKLYQYIHQENQRAGSAFCTYQHPSSTIHKEPIMAISCAGC